MDYLIKRIQEKLLARGRAEQERAAEWQRSLKPTLYRGNNLFQELGEQPIEGRYLGQVGLVPGQSVPNIGRNPNKPVIPGLPLDPVGGETRTAVIKLLQHNIVFSIIRSFENGEADDTIFQDIKYCWRRYANINWSSYYCHLNVGFSGRAFFASIGYRDFYCWNGKTISYITTNKMSTKIDSGTIVLGKDEDVNTLLTTIVPTGEIYTGTNVLETYNKDYLYLDASVTYELIYKSTSGISDRRISPITETILSDGKGTVTFYDTSGIPESGALSRYAIVPEYTAVFQTGNTALIITPRYPQNEKFLHINRHQFTVNLSESINPLKILFPAISDRITDTPVYVATFYFYFNNIRIAIVSIDTLTITDENIGSSLQDFIESNVSFSTSSNALAIINLYGTDLSAYFSYTITDDYMILTPTMKEVEITGYCSFNNIVIGGDYAASYTLSKPAKAIPQITYTIKVNDINSLIFDSASATVDFEDAFDYNPINELVIYPDEWIYRLYSQILKASTILEMVNVYLDKVNGSIIFTAKHGIAIFYSYIVERSTVSYTILNCEYEIVIGDPGDTYNFRIYDGWDRDNFTSYNFTFSGSESDAINLVALINADKLSDENGEMINAEVIDGKIIVKSLVSDRPIFIEAQGEPGNAVVISIQYPHSSSCFHTFLEQFKSLIEDSDVSQIATCTYNNGTLYIEQKGADELAVSTSDLASFNIGLNFDNSQMYGLLRFTIRKGEPVPIYLRPSNFYGFAQIGTNDLTIQWEIRRVLSGEDIGDNVSFTNYFFSNENGASLAQMFAGYENDSEFVGIKYSYAKSSPSSWTTALIPYNTPLAIEDRLPLFRSWDLKKLWLLEEGDGQFDSHEADFYFFSGNAFNSKTRELYTIEKPSALSFGESYARLFGYKLSTPVKLSESRAELNDGSEDDSPELLFELFISKVTNFDEPQITINDEYSISSPVSARIDLSKLPDIEGIPDFSGILEDVAFVKQPFQQYFSYLIFTEES